MLFFSLLPYSEIIIFPGFKIIRHNVGSSNTCYIHFPVFYLFAYVYHLLLGYTGLKTIGRLTTAHLDELGIKVRA